LIQGAAKLTGGGIGLVFVGDGAERDRLQSAAKDIPNIRFLPFFPGNKISSVLAAGDAHVITIKRGLEGVVVPSKMYGILAAGRPIVAVAPKECDVVAIGAEKGFSVSADPDDPGQFARCVRQIAADPSIVRRMALASIAAASEFERGKELLKFVNITEEVAQE
jgi:glycosyltransferase involved in cell wall biosynthesis